MAIINRTRDSFYDQGRTFGFEPALAAASAAIEAGADWLDVGGVPFSPIAAPVSADEEADRVVPLISAIRELSDVVISVDTVRPSVAVESIAAGADAINDTSGLHDVAIAKVAASLDATLIITHSKAPPGVVLPRPTYADVVNEVREFLFRQAALAESLGVHSNRIIIDPGHDLNKNTNHSLELTRRLSEIADSRYPLLTSVSNKDFVGETLGLPAHELLEGTIAATTMCILQGARIVRVHDTIATVRAVRMIETVLGWRSPNVLRHNFSGDYENADLMKEIAVARSQVGRLGHEKAAD